MKPRLQTSLGQQLVMTPQLRQAIRLLQMSTAELEIEITEAVETNPLLDWDDSVPNTDDAAPADTPPDDPRETASDNQGDEWSPDESPWSMDGVSHGSGGSFDDDDDQGTAAERVAETDTLQDHLLWQLHLSHLSPRDRRIGAALIDALEDDGYLRESLSGIAETLLPEVTADEDEILTVLHQLQRFDPVGVAARTLGECLHLQLAVLSDDTPGRALALQIVDGASLERLPKSGIAGLA
ncbi:MAG: RNA polymerase factor sigma-54, partial [Pseudoxanthomonas sp.]